MKLLLTTQNRKLIRRNRLDIYFFWGGDDACLSLSLGIGDKKWIMKMTKDPDLTDNRTQDFLSLEANMLMNLNITRSTYIL